MNSKDIDKAYISPYDKFLYQFNQRHELSPSQVKEMLKHQRIAELRDNPNALDDSIEIWEAF